MLLVTLTLLSFISTSIQECGENHFADSCWDDPNIATITYNSATDSLECGNYDQAKDACTAVQPSLGGKKAEDLTGKMCEELCDVSHAAGGDESLQCEFFRWEKFNLHCTLMNKDQCDGGPNPCERGECVSGQTGCNGGDSPIPKDATCAAGVAFVAESVHWLCTHPTDYSIHINIYGGDEVPSGTSCITAHKCKTFDTGDPDPVGDPMSNSLRVRCNATSTEKKWVQYPGSLNDVPSPTYMDANSLTLVDPLCEEKAAPIDLNKDELQKPGVSFICEYVPNLEFTQDKVTVTAPNTCALLCNQHHVLTLESELSRAGDGVWMKYDAGSDEGLEVNETNVDVVKCWDSMLM